MDYERAYDWNKVIALMISDVDDYGCEHCLCILKKAVREEET